ncbi:MAG: hypothetical protein HY674_05285 [Chloroflexi bacterium]|nr:hypothetical protein [Chloroflexota bacterium]
MPTPRNRAAAGVIEGKLYVAGGNGAGNLITAILEVYDPATDIWSTRQPMPTALTHLGGAVLNGKLYVLGGHTGSSHANTVFVYEPTSNTWTSKAPMPVGLSSVMAAVINDRIYLEGVEFDGTYHFLIYNSASDTWTHKLTVPRSPPTNFGIGASVGAINGKFYAAGGHVSGQINGLDVLRVYDPVADTWMLKAPMPSARTQGRGAAVNGLFYVIGGFQPGAAGGGDRASVFEYDPVSNSWLTKTPMPSWRQASAVGVIGGKIYLAGGDNDVRIVAETAIYTPDTVAPPDDLDGCEAELAAAQQEIQSLQSQLASAGATIQNLTQANQSLTIQNGLLQSQLNAANQTIQGQLDQIAQQQGQINSLTAENTQLQTANAQLTTQLAAANRTIQDQQSQINSLAAQNTQLQTANRQLTAQLNAANQTIQEQQSQITQLQSQLGAVGDQSQHLSQDFRALFNDPQFQIPGATPAQQIANLVAAVGNLNFGQKQALYLNLGGTKPGKGK